MSQDKGESSNSNHVNEFRHRDKEFDSVLNVIRSANMNPHLICPKRIIGETDNGDSELHSTGEFQKRLREMCNKVVKENFANFDVDLLSMFGKDIITENYGSINFDKAGLLIESSAQLYDGKVDHLHALVLKTAKSLRQGGQTEGQKNVSDQEEDEDEEEYEEDEVPDDMEDADLEGDGLDAIGDGGKLKSSMDSPLANISESEKQAEADAHGSLSKQQVKQDLENDEPPAAFDINEYGERVMQKLSDSADPKNTAPLAAVVQGEEKKDVARSFSALLHLANDGKIDLEKSDTTDGEFRSEFAVHFLRSIERIGKRRQEVKFEASKRRAVSPITVVDSKDLIGSSGKENLKPLSSTPTSKNDESPLSD